MDGKKLSPFELQLAPGEVVFHEGNKGEEMYYIREGKIKISIRGGDQEKVLSVLTDGAFFGETALIDGKPRIATATAIEKTELLIVNKESFEADLDANPVLAHMLKTVVQRMRDIAELYYEKKEDKSQSPYRL